MSYNQLITSLQSTGYPVAEVAFSTENRPAMPYITYQRTGDKSLYADGVLYWYCGQIEVHLFTAEKNQTAENKVRTALAGIPFSWAESKNSAQNCYDITIKMEV